jgi:hypothetical protein
MGAALTELISVSTCPSACDNDVGYIGGSSHNSAILMTPATADADAIAVRGTGSVKKLSERNAMTDSITTFVLGALRL